MTLKVNFIEGSRKNSCNNSALSIVDTSSGREKLLVILPLYETGPVTSAELLSAFNAARQDGAKDLYRATLENLAVRRATAPAAPKHAIG